MSCLLWLTCTSRPTILPHSEPIHPPGTLEQYLPKDKHLGPVDMNGVEVVVKEETEEEKQRKIRVANKPPIDECLSLYDFEVGLLSLSASVDQELTLMIQAVAKSILPTAAWAYCSSSRRRTPPRGNPPR